MSKSPVKSIFAIALVAIVIVTCAFFFGTAFNYYVAFPLVDIKATFMQSLKFSAIGVVFSLFLQSVARTITAIGNKIVDAKK